MANYKDIHGTHVETVSSDPSNPVNGQIWYNSTTQTLKGFTQNPAGSWATGNAMNTGRYSVGATGTSTSAIAFGGRVSPPNAIIDNAETYNGTSWTEVADLGTARFQFGSSSSGSATAALAFGGNPSTANAETWGGSSWTEGANLNTARTAIAGCGTTTAALAVNGNSNATETWNGSAWT